ncbi:MAG: KH domain-containing protein [Spirochaetaceae bacterium]|nr:MAG: KH domain-containing protein [Spirochaetaceae bacterium]
MALKIFQGKTEAEAVEAAAQELGISRGNLKYEVIGTKKKGLFSKGEVRIGIEMGGENSEPVYDDEQEEEGLPVSEEIVAKVIDFVSGMIDKMELAGQVKLTSSANNKICLSIESEDSRILIGKKGKTLDALQVLANSIAQNLSQDGVRTIIDCENYRMRRQEKILDFAEQVADHVRRTHGSRLLEPMNPYERRLIHTALTRFTDIETVSEGDGLYKQIRIRYRERDYR